VEDYLKSLQTKVILECSNEFNIPRIAQLTQKTNQFNMTTKRYTQEEITEFHNSPDYVVMSCQVTDIYGDNGITGVCIVNLNDQCAQIDSFLLSCRVLGRNVEYAFLNLIISILRGKGIQAVTASYRKTDKNKANMDFYSKAGFSLESATENEVEYHLDESMQLFVTDQIETAVKGEAW